MKNKANKPHSTDRTAADKKNDHPAGYPHYPDSEDIYEKFQEEKDISPEDTSKMKPKNNTNALEIEDLDEENIGKGLDVPGSELDDDMEEIGSEDEENNYYSLGGDNHEDLEENTGRR
ncbi:MAG: hypothetical protein KUL83_01075 [Lentimicrobium sp.]|jgi:hypothetical protein|nr:hypothetical protein [Lentimicrobium sp.]MDD2529387.1 hypothetical protein [Lentimicrobiaceae bacterium]